MAANRDVVVTGMGAVTAVGVGVEALRQAGRAGKTGVGPITEFDVTNLPVKFAATVRGFDPSTVLDAKQVRLAARVVQLAMGAAMEACGSDAPGALGDVTRVGTIVGTSAGGLDVIAEQMDVLAVKGPRRVSPFSVPQLMDNASAAWIALRWGFRGPAYSMSTACATGLDTLGVAFDMIRAGRLDAVLAGGSDAAVIPYMLASFSAARLHSHANDTPELASRPFDRDRDGFVTGEGSALMMLETRERAQARGATILGRVLGYGCCSDTQEQIITTNPKGEGLAAAIRSAMEQAKVTPADIGYISAHGMGSKTEDISEANAIRAAYGEHASRIPVGATKSMTGYTMGAAGAVSALAGLVAVHDGLLLPHVTFRNPDPAIQLNIIKGEAQKQPVKVAAVHAMGFGGHNACLILGAP